MISGSESCHTAASPTPSSRRTGNGIFPVAQASSEALPRPGRTLTVMAEKPVVRNAQDCPSPAKAVAWVIGACRKPPRSAALRISVSQGEIAATTGGSAGLGAFEQLVDRHGAQSRRLSCVMELIFIEPWHLGQFMLFSRRSPD